MQGLTHRQQMVLDFIRESIADRGYPPTLREIGARMGIRSTNGVNDHLRALERKGYLKREDMKSRALRPTGVQLPLPVSQMGGEAANNVHQIRGGELTQSEDEDLVEISIVGRVAAGPPVLCGEHVVDTAKSD